MQNGYARLEKKGRWDSKEKLAALDALDEHQQTARKARLHIWEYGDMGESDDEDQPAWRGAAGGGRGRGGR